MGGPTAGKKSVCAPGVGWTAEGHVLVTEGMPLCSFTDPRSGPQPPVQAGSGPAQRSRFALAGGRLLSIDRNEEQATKGAENQVRSPAPSLSHGRNELR